jgi:hypothetical protein
MSIATVDDFRSTLMIIKEESSMSGDELYTYWNNRSASPVSLGREELLHIKKRSDGAFFLEIGNMQYQGSLKVLEQKLYEWALEEGWLEVESHSKPNKQESISPKNSG